MREWIKQRGLPQLLSRQEMVDILIEEEYGQLPSKPENLQFEVVKTNARMCAGKAILTKLTCTCEVNGKIFSFPFQTVLPTAAEKHPFFIHCYFKDAACDRHIPIEEIVDQGFAVLSVCYTDVTSDNWDFTDGLAGVLFENGQRKPNDPGKIAMWAWAMQRVMDYAQTLGDVLDLSLSCSCGHSRLGKTALFAAMTDERFAFAYSNNSGCSGAAISREKVGEDVKFICGKFGYWFCENYFKHGENVQEMPFDQHYLVASIAPRKVLIGSASEDEWADPLSEQLCCFGASDAFKKPFVCPDRPAEIGEAFYEGHIGYHLRKGCHYFSREDWNNLIRFINMHRDD